MREVRGANPRRASGWLRPIDDASVTEATRGKRYVAQVRPLSRTSTREAGESLLALGVLLVGCQGVVGDPARTGDSEPEPIVCDEPPAPFPVRRLTAEQLRQTAVDVLGVDRPVPVEDERLGTFPSNGSVAVDTNMASALSSWAGHVAAAAAPALADGAECAGGSDECIEHLLRAVGPRLYRRPIEGEDAERLEVLFATIEGTHDRSMAVRSMLEAMLQSPYFLYQVEHADGPDRWSQLARLSYALWNGGPDAALMARADELTESESAEALVEDMLDDRRFERGLGAFMSPWLMLDHMDDANRRTDLHGELEAETLQALRSQARATMMRAIAEGATFAELLRLTEVPAAEPLRELYGDELLEDRGDTWVIDGSRRRGLLGLPGVLAANSGPESSSPTHRGVMVLSNLLCSPPQAPPPNVTTELPEIEGATTRQRLESHRDDPSCASCHESIDGIGFAFEHYDWFGRYRTEENGWPIDASGRLVADGMVREVADAVELADALAQSEQAHDCFAEMWLTYAAGRSPTPADACLMEEMAQELDAPAGLRAMLVRLFASDEFLRGQQTPREEVSP